MFEYSKVKTKSWTHEKVNKKGIIKSGGSVKTKQGISSSLSAGCTITSCNCFKGHWIAMNFGYDKKTKSVSGITFYFDCSIELDEFRKSKYATISYYLPLQSSTTGK